LAIQAIAGIIPKAVPVLDRKTVELEQLVALADYSLD
jgi:hypothetical protein